MTKPRRTSPEDAAKAIRTKEGFVHEPCPRCPEDPDHQPFSPENVSERRRLGASPHTPPNG